MAAHNLQPSPPALCRRSGRSFLKRPLLSSPGPENTNGAPPPMLHFLTPPNPRGKYLDFHSFDEAYLNRLRAGDFRTQEHFSTYFSTLLKIKLRSRLNSPEAIEDVRQETFSRFFVALHSDKIRQPERLGSYVNSMCNNVLLEYYRSSVPSNSIDDGEEENNLPSLDINLLDALLAKETEKKVREILDQLSERDRRLLREVFLEERDKDDVCRDFGVDREYLRVLLHRAKQAFKSAYIRHSGKNPPDFARA